MKSHRKQPGSQLCRHRHDCSSSRKAKFNREYREVPDTAAIIISLSGILILIGLMLAKETTITIFILILGVVGSILTMLLSLYWMGYKSPPNHD